ncbi:NAD(P)-dependent oxidoreductase [Rhodophyticola porphyridii]|uniref:NAD(P)-dependent oxidoreductase n=1 Tax=Rhodophyticola porphyridii TaxID=1852017 RepID=A0A3L9YET1_9RHOB|nr:NAD(P)-dependent oxidoreductase [Rhodophyticola porphyridii]
MSLAIIGLGNMGSAIAEAAITGGHQVAVWNRTPEKAEAFADRATVAESLAEAIAATDMQVWVLSDYETTEAVLAETGVSAALAGKTFVQLCSGTPAEARALSAKVTDLGARYLDGKIFTYPARVGAEMTRFAYSGDEVVYKACAPTLKTFGARSGWLGPDPGFAAAADLAWLSYLYGSMVGLFQGLAFTRAEGMPDEAVFGSVPSWLVEIDAEARYSKELIERGDFHGGQAELDVHFAAMQHLLDTAQATSISNAFPRMIVDVFGEALERGYGGMEITGGLEVFCKP